MNDIIDCHVHITESGRWYNTKLDSSIGSLLSQMDIAGVSKSVLLPIRGEVNNQFVKKICLQYEDRFIGFGNISVHSWKTDLNEIVDFNLKGIKFHPRIQHETLMDWDKSGLLYEVERLSLPILICGWQQTSSVNANMRKIEPLFIDEIAKKYINLKIIIAHMGGHKFLDAFFCARGNPNVYLDTSYFFTFFKGTSLEIDALTLLTKIDEKVLFGSDFPERNLCSSLEYIISQSEVFKFDIKKILCSNVYKLLNNE